jgi:hypothetical protein
MTRRTETRFGTFTKLLGTAVHANGWWLRHAAGVDLQCETPSLHDLSNVIASPERSDLARVKRSLPIGLQMADGHDLPIGFIATRVEDAPGGGLLDWSAPLCWSTRRDSQPGNLISKSQLPYSTA